MVSSVCVCKGWCLLTLHNIIIASRRAIGKSRDGHNCTCKKIGSNIACRNGPSEFLTALCHSKATKMAAIVATNLI